MLEVKHRYKKTLAYLLPLVFFLMFADVSKAGSEVVAIDLTWEGVDTPKPTQIGLRVNFRAILIFSAFSFANPF